MAWEQIGGGDGTYYRQSIAPGATQTGGFAAYAAGLGISEDPQDDPDGDGANSAYEFLTGSDPGSAVSQPAPLQVSLDSDGILSVSQPNFRPGYNPVRRSSIEVSRDLDLWIAPNGPDTTIEADGSAHFLLELDLSINDSRFYRVRFQLVLGD